MFDATPEEVAALGEALFATCSEAPVSDVVEFEEAANARLRREAGHEHDLEVRLVGSAWPSAVYHAGDRPLPFTGFLRVHPEAGNGKVRVTIETLNPRVTVGERFALLAPCPGNRPVAKSVAATTVVEYVVLRAIGERLSAKGMPAIRVPDKGVAALCAQVERGVGRATERSDAGSAARVLGLIRARRAVPVLAKALAAGGHLAVVAAQALGEIGDPAAVPALAQALGSAEDGVRLASARALGRFGSAAKEAGPALRAAYRKAHGTGDVSIFVEALAQVDPGSRDVRAMLDSGKDRLRVAGSLATLGVATARTVPLLIEGLRARADRDRWWAAMTLAELGDAAEADTAELRSVAAHDPERGVRAAATFALFRIRGSGGRRR